MSKRGQHEFRDRWGHWRPRAIFENFDDAWAARLRILDLTGRAYQVKRCWCSKYHLRKVTGRDGRVPEQDGCLRVDGDDMMGAMTEGSDR